MNEPMEFNEKGEWLDPGCIMRGMPDEQGMCRPVQHCPSCDQQRDIRLRKYLEDKVWVPCEKCKGSGYLADEDTGSRIPDSTDTPCNECMSSGGHYERKDAA